MLNSVIIRTLLQITFHVEVNTIDRLCNLLNCRVEDVIFHAVLAAALYAINAPISKLLLIEIPSTMMAGLLYLGAGIGMYILERLNKNREELP